MLQVVLWTCLVGLVLALCMAGYRTLSGSTMPARIVGMDAGGTVLINLLIVGAMLLNDQQYLAYAIVLSALNYCSTMVLGKYVQGGGVIGRGDLR